MSQEIRTVKGLVARLWHPGRIIDILRELRWDKLSIHCYVHSDTREYDDTVRTDIFGGILHGDENNRNVLLLNGETSKRVNRDLAAVVRQFQIEPYVADTAGCVDRAFLFLLGLPAFFGFAMRIETGSRINDATTPYIKIHSVDWNTTTAPEDQLRLTACSTPHRAAYENSWILAEMGVSGWHAPSMYTVQNAMCLDTYFNQELAAHVFDAMDKLSTAACRRDIETVTAAFFRPFVSNVNDIETTTSNQLPLSQFRFWHAQTLTASFAHRNQLYRPTQSAPDAHRTKTFANVLDRLLVYADVLEEAGCTEYADYVRTRARVGPVLPDDQSNNDYSFAIFGCIRQQADWPQLVADALVFICFLGVPIGVQCSLETWSEFGNYLQKIFPIRFVELLDDGQVNNVFDNSTARERVRLVVAQVNDKTAVYRHFRVAD